VKHFKMSELTASATARRAGINNHPSIEHERNLWALMLGLEQVRAVLGGRPIIITSGYRNPRVNRLVGGVPGSDHAVGWAADFRAPHMSLFEAAKRVHDSPLIFDQLIHEVGRCVHISFNPRLRRQSLTQTGGPGSPITHGIG
jgi:zinc D-Ala-D-Ala carboxypeptidase